MSGPLLAVKQFSGKSMETKHRPNTNYPTLEVIPGLNGRGRLALQNSTTRQSYGMGLVVWIDNAHTTTAGESAKRGVWREHV